MAESVTTGLRCPPEIGPSASSSAISPPPVASEFASNASAVLPPASCCARMPEPTTTATSSAVPSPSATRRLASVIAGAGTLGPCGSAERTGSVVTSEEGARIGFAVAGGSAQCSVFRRPASMHAWLVLNEPGVSNARRVLLDRHVDCLDTRFGMTKSEVRTRCESRIRGGN